MQRGGALQKNQESIQVETLFRIIGEQEPKRILDAGCGYGRLSRELARNLDEAEIIAVDQSRSMLSEVTKLENSDRIAVVQAGLDHLPIGSRTIDLVICIGVIMHVARERASLGELVRVLASNGCLLLSYHNALNPFSVFSAALAHVLKTGPEKSCHLRRFYQTSIANRGFMIKTHAAPVIPGFPLPESIATTAVKLDARSANLGFEPILECRRVG